MTNWIEQFIHAKFTYNQPDTAEQFSVEKLWSCQLESLAGLIVTQYALKTGAIASEYKLVKMDMPDGHVLEVSDAQN
jgi:hypothetical protein